MTLEMHHRLILDRDIRTMGHEVIASLSSDLLNKYQLSYDDEDLSTGQPHQKTRRFLRDGIVARLGDEDLLDEILIDEMFGQGS